MTEYVGLALIGLSLIGIVWRSLYLYRIARKQRLQEALQSFIDELVELYDNEANEPRA
jgi:cbb3-type cytochrome oxidase subunit 3